MSKKKEKVTAITIVNGCGASGKSLLAGETYKVPARISEEDAETLIRIGKAVSAADPDAVSAAKKAAKVKAEADAKAKEGQ